MDRLQEAAEINALISCPSCGEYLDITGDIDNVSCGCGYVPIVAKDDIYKTWCAGANYQKENGSEWIDVNVQVPTDGETEYFIRVGYNGVDGIEHGYYDVANYNPKYKIWMPSQKLNHEYIVTHYMAIKPTPPQI